MALCVSGGFAPSASNNYRRMCGLRLWSSKGRCPGIIFFLYKTSISYTTHKLVQVFDSWAGELSPELFQLFSLPYLQQIVSRVKRQTPIPMTVFAKGAHYATEWLLQTDYDCISLDYTADVCAVKKLAREYLSRPNCSRQRIVFQGNMDPVVLFSDQQTVARECEKTLYKFLINEETGELEQPDRIGYVCNLGHGIQPEVPVENVQVFLETVKRVSEQIFSMAKKNN
jgi:uroporphyrinogen decarboxylase